MDPLPDQPQPLASIAPTYDWDMSIPQTFEWDKQAPGNGSEVQARGALLPAMESISLGSEPATSCAANGAAVLTNGTRAMVRDKKLERKEKPLSPWRVEDFVKDEVWFRDVIGLPASGETIGEKPIKAEELEAFYGKKVLGGYPFKRGLLTKEMRDEILHLKLFTDGDIQVPNDVLLVGFAKGYYMMRQQGLDVNWARFAASKHRGQLEGQIKLRKHVPTPGTGIRDENKKYFPFSQRNVIQPCLIEFRNDVDCKAPPSTGISSAHAASSFELNLTLGTQQSRTYVAGPSSLPPDSSTKIPSTTHASSVGLEQIVIHGSQNSDAFVASSSVPPLNTSASLPAEPVGIPPGSMKTVVENFRLLDDYIVALEKAFDVVGPGVEKFTTEYDAMIVRLKEAASGIVLAKEKESSERQIYLRSSELKSTAEKEVAKLMRKLEAAEEELDLRWAKVQEAKADVNNDDATEEDELESTYYNECAAEFEQSNTALDVLKMEIVEKSNAIAGLDGRIRDAKSGEKKARADHRELVNSIEFLNDEVERVGDDLSRLKKGHSHLQSTISHFRSLKESLTKSSKSYLTPAMVPSTIKNYVPLFRLSNCPICELGFAYGNFLPTSCGHAYHPACGLAYFQTMDEPRCKACDVLLHPSWLKSWGLSLGPANLEMEAHLGMDIHEHQLNMVDRTLREDPELYDELKYWNYKQRGLIRRRYSSNDNRAEIRENNRTLALLREGYNYRNPMILQSLASKKKEGILKSDVESKADVESKTLLSPKLEGKKVAVLSDSEMMDDSSDAPHQFSKAAPITRSKGAIKKRKGVALGKREYPKSHTKTSVSRKL